MRGRPAFAERFFRLRRLAQRHIQAAAPERMGAKAGDEERQCDQGEQQDERGDKHALQQRYAVHAKNGQQPGTGGRRGRQGQAEDQPALSRKIIAFRRHSSRRMVARRKRRCGRRSSMRTRKLAISTVARRPEGKLLSRHRRRAKRRGGVFVHGFKLITSWSRLRDFFVFGHLELRAVYGNRASLRQGNYQRCRTFRFPTMPRFLLKRIAR